MWSCCGMRKMRCCDSNERLSDMPTYDSQVYSHETKIK